MAEKLLGQNRRTVNQGKRDYTSHYDWNVGHASSILTVMDDGLFRTPTQIRKRLDMDKPLLDGTLARLIKLGGLERRPKPGIDQRLPPGVRASGWLYRITDKGRKRKPPTD